MRTRTTRIKHWFLLATWSLISTLSSVERVDPASAPALLLANQLGLKVDPTKYLVSEKFDGVRAIWDGKMLRFRSGRPVHAPAGFIAKLPAQPVDGELWLGRGGFEALSGIVCKTEPLEYEWRQIKYMIFELPDAPGTFAERAERIREIVTKTNWPQLIAVEQFRVANRAVLKRKLDEFVRGGVEEFLMSDALIDQSHAQIFYFLCHEVGKAERFLMLCRNSPSVRLQGIADSHDTFGCVYLF